MPPKKQASASASKDEEKEDVYEIKRILAYDRRNGQDFFQVEWDGYPLSEATWEPRGNFFNPEPEIKKRMEHLKKEASKVVANGSPAPAAVKRKRTSTATSAPTKKRRTRDASPSPATKPTPPASAKRAASPKTRTSIVEEPTSAAEEPASSEGEIQKSPRRTPSQRSSAEARSSKERFKVKSIKRNESNNHLEVVLQPGDDSDAKFAIPVDQARNKYPQELIDFLLGRIQFRGSSRCESP